MKAKIIDFEKMRNLPRKRGRPPIIPNNVTITLERDREGRLLWSVSPSHPFMDTDHGRKVLLEEVSEFLEGFCEDDPTGNAMNDLRDALLTALLIEREP